MISHHLHHRVFWSFVLGAYLFTVFATGLIPLGDGGSGYFAFPHSDKLAHFLIYFGLAFLFQQLIERPPRVLLARAFVIGLIIELLQTQIPTRGYETADLLANTLGAFSGLVVSARLLPGILLRWDQSFSSQK